MRKLAVGEKVIGIPIQAEKSWNGTGILVCAGENYRIDASSEVWSDAGIECTAAGQPGRGIQKMFRAFVRCRQAKWFELVAIAGKSNEQMHPIGLGKDVSFSMEGNYELGFFANDVFFMYFNNSGVIHVAITRET